MTQRSSSHVTSTVERSNGESPCASWQIDKPAFRMSSGSHSLIRISRRRVELLIGDLLSEVLRLHVLLCRRARLLKNDERSQSTRTELALPTCMPCVFSRLSSSSSFWIVSHVPPHISPSRGGSKERKAHRRLRDLPILFRPRQRERTKHRQSSRHRPDPRRRNKINRRPFFEGGQFQTSFRGPFLHHLKPIIIPTPC